MGYDKDSNECDECGVWEWIFTDLIYFDDLFVLMLKINQMLICNWNMYILQNALAKWFDSWF